MEFSCLMSHCYPLKVRGKKEGMQLRSLRPETSKEEEKEAGRVREAGSGFRLSTDPPEG